MGKRCWFRIAVVVLAAMAASACGRGQESSELTALDNAYRSGVITRSEYDAKKAALGNRAASLAALDKARDAGLLTPAEYQAHKEKLMAGAPAPAPTAAASAPAAAMPDAAMQGAATPAAAMPAAAMPGGGDNPTAQPATGAPAAKGVRQEEIFDPHLGLNAYDVTVPADWKFAGTYVAGSSCVGLPFPVFRMYSPDGLTEFRRLPRFDWFWTNTKFKGQQGDCLDLKQEISGQEFVKRIANMLQVTYVRDYPVPQQLQDAMQKNIAQFNATLAANSQRLDRLNASLPGMAKTPKNQPPVRHGSIVAAVTEFQNGSFTIEELINVRLLCTHSPLNLGPDPNAFTETCEATVVLLRAPKGKLEAAVALSTAENLGARENSEWANKYFDFMDAQAKARSDKIMRDGAAQRAQSQADFDRAQAVRAQQHQQFMATLQAGTNASMARTQAAGDARHAVAQDWCDYALDRQTVTGAGGTVKVSSAYSNTWTDGNGHYYQTNYSDINPNGFLSGNWTQTTQVHGDGTAK